MVHPKPLKEGDTVAICSPAGAVDPRLFGPAIDLLERQGWNVRVMPHAMGRYGTYSGQYADRLHDLVGALADQEVRAVICGRGGYGAVQLLHELDDIDLRNDPKWLIGFSDISALHAWAASQGVASIHSSMLRGLALYPDTSQTNELFSILRGESPRPMRFPSRRNSREGEAQGRIVGGNLSVLCALIGTKYDIFKAGDILFIEDVNEPIYKVERMMWQLCLAGVLPRLRGLVVGQFTGAGSDDNFDCVNDMIDVMVAPYSYPVAYDAPIGHSGQNMPIIELGEARLQVCFSETKLELLPPPLL